MRSHRFAISSSLLASVAGALLFATTVDVRAQAAAASIDSLRERFPAASIDSIEKADAALSSTSGAKVRVEKDYKDAARACIAKILVNACVDEARAQRRKRLADIDAVEIEANRFKRRDRADRLEADKAKRDAERAANAPADAAQRERNRQAYENKQTDAARSTAGREHSATTHAATAAKPHGPVVKLAPLAGSAPTPDQRAKNAVDFAKHQQVAEAHAKDIDRRVAEKTAERKRRDDAKAAKDAKTAAAAQAAADAARTGFPSIAGPKP